MKKIISAALFLAMLLAVLSMPGVFADDNPAYRVAAEFKGEPLPFDFYPMAPVETWAGNGVLYWQFVVYLDPEYVDFRQGLIADSPYRWVVSLRTADSNEAWRSTEAELKTTTTLGDNVLYRLLPGEFIFGEMEDGDEYEVMVQVFDTAEDECLFRNEWLMYFSWSDKLEGMFTRWKNGTGSAPSYYPEVSGDNLPWLFVKAPETVPGDLSGNGILSIQDVTVLLKLLAGPAEKIPASADLTGDGAVTAKDVSRLLQMLGAA